MTEISFRSPTVVLPFSPRPGTFWPASLSPLSALFASSRHHLASLSLSLVCLFRLAPAYFGQPLSRPCLPFSLRSGTFWPASLSPSAVAPAALALRPAALCPAALCPAGTSVGVHLFQVVCRSAHPKTYSLQDEVIMVAIVRIVFHLRGAGTIVVLFSYLP